jgi:hypothetical protein
LVKLFSYILASKNNYNENSIYLSHIEQENDSSVWLTDPCTYFDNAQVLRKDGLIGVANFAKKWKKSHLYFYPFAPYVDPAFRNKKIGNYMYKLILASVQKMCSKLKTKPKFGQHGSFQPHLGGTSKQAKRIYSSLENAGYLKKHRIMNSGHIFKITKFPLNITFVYKTDVCDTWGNDYTVYEAKNEHE